MAKVIIAIHGLRNKPPKYLLQKWWIMSIKEGMDYFGESIEIPKLELVYWADIINNKPLSLDEKDKESPYYIDEKYVVSRKIKKCKKYRFRQISILLLKRIIYAIFLRKDFSLRFPKISQKLIHNNFSSLEVYFNENCEADRKACEQRDQINERLISILEKYKNDEIFFIAHSMGSIVGFDVLSFLAPKININTFITMGSPLGAPFVLSRIAKLYKSNIQAHIKLQTPESVNMHWYNFADIKDSIALDYKLSEEFKENTKGVKVQDFLVINTYKTNGKSNHHKSFGYLRTPEFIKVLIDFINE
jgi:hypothetical protein